MEVSQQTESAPTNRQQMSFMDIQRLNLTHDLFNEQSSNILQNQTHSSVLQERQSIRNTIMNSVETNHQHMAVEFPFLETQLRNIRLRQRDQATMRERPTLYNTRQPQSLPQPLPLPQRIHIGGNDPSRQLSDIYDNLIKIEEQIVKDKHGKNIYHLVLTVLFAIILINGSVLYGLTFNTAEVIMLLMIGITLIFFAFVLLLSKLGTTFQAIEVLVMGLFFLVLHFNCNNHQEPLVIYIFYWPFLHIMGWVSVNVKWDSPNDPDSQQYVYLIFGFRCLVFVQVMMVLLKIDTYVDITWFSIFVPSLIFLTFTSLIIIQAITYLCHHFCNLSEPQRIHTEGVVWETSLLLSTYGACWITLVALVALLEGDYQIPIFIAISFNAVISLIILLLSLSYAPKLLKFLSDNIPREEIESEIKQAISKLNKEVLQQQEEFVPTLQLPQHLQQLNSSQRESTNEQPQFSSSITTEEQQQQQLQPQPDVSQLTNNITQRITKFFKSLTEKPPSYLIRISSTYFKQTYSSKPELKRNKADKQSSSSSEQQIPSLQQATAVDEQLFEDKLKRKKKLRSESHLDSVQEKGCSVEQTAGQGQGQVRLSLHSSLINQINSQPMESTQTIPYILASPKSSIRDSPELLPIPDRTSEEVCSDLSRNENKSQQNISTTMSTSKKDSTCIICFENPSNSVFMNCGHGGMCKQCAIDISIKTGVCFLCREPIEKIIRVNELQANQKYQEVVSVTCLHMSTHKIEPK